MSEQTVESQLTDIQNKLAVITEEIERQKRARIELEELKTDLTVIAKDAFSNVVHELEDVAPFVNSGDFTHLLKKLLRNTNTIANTIEKFESAVDFAEDAGPIGKELFNDTLHKLNDLDTRGYFELVRGVGQGMDKLVQHISPEDLDRLFSNLIIIVDLMKMLGRTNFIPALEKSIKAMENIPEKVTDKFSPWMVHKELSTPEMRRIFGNLLHFFLILVNELKSNNIKN